MDREKVGRYRILREIGRGGMGVVYLAHDPNTDRDLAVKMLDLRGFTQEQSDEISERFQREAKAAGRLGDCPNIIKIFDAAEHEGEYYIAMEFAPGKSLEDILDEEPIMPITRALEIIEGIANALDHAHSMGIVHRDVKPANVLVTDKGAVKVTDFGIARIENLRMTRTGAMLGSPSYMSPEQILGKEIDGTADVFALGVILYIMLTGEKPFPGESLATLTYRIVQEHPTPPSQINPSLDPAFDVLIKNALVKDPRQRYQTAGDLARDLRKLVAPGEAPPDFNSTFSSTRSAVGTRVSSMASITAIPVPDSFQAGKTFITTSVGDETDDGFKMPPRRLMIAVALFSLVIIIGFIIVLPRFFADDESLTSPGSGVAFAEDSKARRGIVPKTFVLWKQANEARATGDMKQALVYLKELEFIDPADAEVVLLRAKVNYDLHNYREAMEGYKRALQLEPSLKDDQDLIEQLVDGIDSGSSKDAMAIIVELIGDSAEAKLIEVSASPNAKTKKNAFVALEELWKRRLETTPADTNTRILLARARFMLEKYPDALLDYKQIVAEKPQEKKNSELIVNVIDMLKTDVYQGAMNLLVEIGPPALPYLKQVPPEKGSKKYQRSLETLSLIYRKQISDEPGNATPAFELAMEMSKAGNQVEATRFASEALKRNPSLASDIKIVNLLIEALKTPESGASDVIAKQIGASAAPSLKPLIKSEVHAQRWGAAAALDAMGKGDEINAVDLWVTDLKDPDSPCEAIMAAYDNLKKIDSPEAKKAVAAAESDKKIKKCLKSEGDEPSVAPKTPGKTPTKKTTTEPPKKKRTFKQRFGIK